MDFDALVSITLPTVNLLVDFVAFLFCYRYRRHSGWIYSLAAGHLGFACGSAASVLGWIVNLFASNREVANSAFELLLWSIRIGNYVSFLSSILWTIGLAGVLHDFDRRRRLWEQLENDGPPHSPATRAAG